MKLPPWNCITVEEQMAFAEFVIRRLDELYIAEANAPVSAEAFEHVTEEAKRQHFVRLAREHNLEIQPLPARRGAPRKLNSGTPLECAIRDATRMRAIFREHWGKSNRHTRPTREDIAADYWELSAGDREALVRHFTKAAKPDD